MEKLTVLDSTELAMGTSHKGSIVGYKFLELFAALGAPSRDEVIDGTGCVEWCIDFKGEIFTVYDWIISDRIWVLSENEAWRVGGKSAAGEFIAHVIGLMDKNRK